ncbi:unnamed protein product [Lupinus luteus]|uniref:K Homology domain-containing protein n=1 Tax=Lupinus luteus TaxID=3873 RepID=A0AAV1W7L4_LUPLU
MGAESLYPGGSVLSLSSMLPSVPHASTPLAYDQRNESGSGLGMLSQSRLYGYRPFSMGDNDYGPMSSYAPTLYGGLPPPSTLEILVPGNAVGKVLGKGGANIANIRKSVFGKEKPRRVRCHGRVTTPTLLKRTEEIAKIEKKNMLMN